MQKFVIVLKFFLIYLAEAMVETELPSLIGAGVFCLKKSPRLSELLCQNRSITGHFSENKSLVLLLWSRIWYCLIGLL